MGLFHHIRKHNRWHLKDKNPVGTKIVIDNKTIEQVNLFNYLGNMISYEQELGIDNKLHNYWKITGIFKKFV